ncbi:MAG: hypothetical protein R8J85_00840, partial [Mariprofundales bacterium]
MPDKYIIVTSSEEPTSKNEGDWWGILILGIVVGIVWIVLISLKFFFTHPNFSIPIVFILTGFFTWLVTSRSTGSDKSAGRIIIALLGVLSTLLVYGVISSIFNILTPLNFINND